MDCNQLHYPCACGCDARAEIGSAVATSSATASAIRRYRRSARSCAVVTCTPPWVVDRRARPPQATDQRRRHMMRCAFMRPTRPRRREFPPSRLPSPSTTPAINGCSSEAPMPRLWAKTRQRGLVHLGWWAVVGTGRNRHARRQDPCCRAPRPQRRGMADGPRRGRQLVGVVHPRRQELDSRLRTTWSRSSRSSPLPSASLAARGRATAQSHGDLRGCNRSASASTPRARGAEPDGSHVARRTDGAPAVDVAGIDPSGAPVTFAVGCRPPHTSCLPVEHVPDVPRLLGCLHRPPSVGTGTGEIADRDEGLGSREPGDDPQAGALRRAHRAVERAWADYRIPGAPYLSWWTARW